DAPPSMLPEVRDTAGPFGKTLAEHLGATLPVYAMAGDQQSALVGQVCLSPGMAKATYGTGGFILLNTGATPIRSQHGLLTTIAYQWDDVRCYALEGSIFSAGATVQWLRDGLGIIATAAEAGALAADSDPEQDVYLVPAFAGLGAPHWRADARCSVMGLTRGATRKELARAALESVGFQTDDLLAAMTEDFEASGATGAESVARVDGGMVASDWTMQFLADIGALAGAQRSRRRCIATNRRHENHLPMRPCIARYAASSPAGVASAAGLAARNTRSRVFRFARSRSAHRQAMPAVRRRHAPWLRDAAAMRRHRCRRPVLLGLGSARSWRAKRSRVRRSTFTCPRKSPVHRWRPSTGARSSNSTASGRSNSRPAIRCSPRIRSIARTCRFAR